MFVAYLFPKDHFHAENGLEWIEIAPTREEAIDKLKAGFANNQEWVASSEYFNLHTKEVK